MPRFYNTLKVDHNRCSPDCSLCEETCARSRGLSRIKAVHVPEIGFHGALMCKQCGEPQCLDICPSGAISKSQIDGVVRIDEEKCVGCGLCSLACTQGGIHYDPETKKAYKCDRCDGEPACVEACIHDSISYIRNQDVLNYFATEDLIAPGTNLCAGCMAELAARFTLRVVGRDAIIFASPGCGSLVLSGLMPRGLFMSGPSYMCLLTNTDAFMTGVKRYYRTQGRDVKLVAFIGDGATADAGFQSLSGAAERGENIIHICYDNEAYMNTGIQRSGTSPFHAWTTTTPVGEKGKGKGPHGKYMPLIMASHGIPYVATATVAYLEDYARKLTKAMAVKDGLSYIHLLTPCPTGWRAPTDSGIEISKMAVETNYFPLWEAENGEYRFTYQPKKPRPLREYTKMMGRFSHLTESELVAFQNQVDEKIAFLRYLCGFKKPESNSEMKEVVERYEQDV